MHAAVRGERSIAFGVALFKTTLAPLFFSGHRCLRQNLSRLPLHLYEGRDLRRSTPNSRYWSRNDDPRVRTTGHVIAGMPWEIERPFRVSFSFCCVPFFRFFFSLLLLFQICLKSLVSRTIIARSRRPKPKCYVREYRRCVYVLILSFLWGSVQRSSPFPGWVVPNGGIYRDIMVTVSSLTFYLVFK